MKGQFDVSVNLLQLKEVLNNKEPFATIAVSTTGLDTADVSHFPTRVSLIQYEYINGLYKETIRFDKLVQAPKEAVEKALENKDYDIFKNAGIDKDAYLRGENVLSVDDFKAEFDRVIKAVKEGEGVLIANNYEHVKTYLEKIDCISSIEELKANDKVLCQNEITKELLKEKKMFGSPTLENARNISMPLPNTATFLRDEKVLKDFNSLSEADFCEKYKDVFSEKYKEQISNHYDSCKKFADIMSTKIQGTDKRAEIMSGVVIKYGKDNDLIHSGIYESLLEASEKYTEELSERAKEDYKNKNLVDKMETLKEMGAIDADAILKGDSAYHKLLNAVNDKNNKGIIIMHASTTGFEKYKKAPQITGQPTQFAAMCYARNEDGKIDFNTKPVGKSFLIEAPSRAVLAAEKEAAKPNGYDAFKEAGIDIKAYKEGINVKTQEEAVKMIDNFYQNRPASDYAYVVIGGASKSYSNSFVQTAFRNLGNMPICDIKTIDFCSAVKDYTFLANEKGLENVLFGSNAIGKFGINDIAEKFGVSKEDIAPCSSKCNFVAACIAKLESQMEKIQEKSKKEVSKEVVEEAVVYDTFNANKIEYPQKNIKEEVIKTDLDKQSEQSEMDLFDLPEDDLFDEILREEGIEIDTWSPKTKGNIYSDVENDEVPVVIAEGKVHTIGSRPIPHISEALKEVKNEVGKELEEPKSKFDNSKFAGDSLADIIRRSTNEMLEAISVQGAVLVKMAEIIDSQAEQIRNLQARNFQELSTNKDIITALEQSQENISSIKNSISNNSLKNQLSNATKTLSDVQRSIEKIDRSKIVNIS